MDKYIDEILEIVKRKVSTDDSINEASVVSDLKELCHEVYDRGHYDGEHSGQDDAFDEGYQEGWDDGYKQGKEDEHREER